MVQLSTLLMSGSKVAATDSAKKYRRPSVPALIKYACWLVWTIVVGYLLYQQENINYVVLAGRVVWLIAMLVSLRDGNISLSSVEYNIQSKSIVGMVAYAFAFWLVTTPQQGMKLDHSAEYCALAICAGFQSFENPFQIMYCRPTPLRVTKWTVIDEYISLPVFLSFMIGMDVVMSVSTGRILATLMIVYKFFRSSMEYNQISVLKTETVPLKHQFTATLETTVKTTPLSPTNIWRIYGNTYDMTQYVEHHPGGVEAILLGANRDDCTAIFQSYHPFNITKAKQVLEKYRVANPKTVTDIDSDTTTTATDSDDDTTITSSSTDSDHAISSTHSDDAMMENNATATAADATTVAHENDLFYDVLCQRVAKTLKESNIDPIQDRIPDATRYAYYTFLLVAIVSSCVAHCRGSLLGSFLFGVFGWLMGAIGHDGGHFAVSRNPIINDYAVWGMSLLCNPIMWQHQHTYAHHSYTNEFDRDPDLHHFDMFLRYHKRYIPHPVYKNQSDRLFVILAFGFTCFGQCYLIPLRFIQERSLYGAVNWSDRKRLIRTVLLFSHFIAYSVIIMAVPFFVHTSTYKAGIAALLPMTVAGWLFAFCSQIGHVTEMCMDGKSNAAELSKRHPIAKESWAAGQIATTNDFCPQSSLWHFMANGLSLQVEHHLFPGLNHCHLQIIQPTIEATCQEFGVNYKKYETWGQVMQAMFDYLNKLAIE